MGAVASILSLMSSPTAFEIELVRNYIRGNAPIEYYEWVHYFEFWISVCFVL